MGIAVVLWPHRYRILGEAHTCVGIGLHGFCTPTTR
jgi:hypothetical protein